MMDNKHYKLIIHRIKMANFERQPACKIWISDLYQGEFVKSDEEFKPNYIILKDKKISRVNLIATVIRKYQKEDGTYNSLIIEDGSAQIRVKCWGEDCKLLKDILPSDIILLIGKIKEDKINENGIYLSPEIIKKVEPNYEVLRKLELIKEIGKPSIISKKEDTQYKEEETEAIEEIKISSTNLRQKLLNIIEKKENITFEEILKEAGDSEKEVSNELNELLKGGEIFEVKGKYNLLR